MEKGKEHSNKNDDGKENGGEKGMKEEKNRDNNDN